MVTIPPADSSLPMKVTTSKDVADAEQGMSVRVSDIVETCGRSLGDLQV